MQEPVRIMPQLYMKRDNLDGLAPVVLPEGYTLRTSLPGDGKHWALILNESFGGDRTEEAFVKEMVEHPAYRAERIFFICAPDGEPCATASAYQQQVDEVTIGYVHYVATRPCHAGNKLGYQVSLAVLHQFKAEGLTFAVLQTDDYRIPALKTYLRLNFHPVLIHENQLQRWQVLLLELGIPEETVKLEWQLPGRE